jgi:TP901 family phage tail tape measure protein
MADTEVGGIVAPVRADISDFISKFSTVNEKANVVSGNLVAKIEQVMAAQQKLNTQGNSFKNNIFASQDNLSDQTISRLNRVIVAQEQVSKRSNQLMSDVAKGSGSDALVRDVNSVIGANNKLSSALTDGATGTRRLAQEQGNLGNVLNSNNKLFEMMRSHLTWFMTGGALVAAFALPMETITRIKELEQAMAGVKQVIPEIEHNQAAANQQLIDFASIAGKYGEASLEVIEAGRSWGRMYKEVDAVNILVSQSAKMATADNFPLAESVKGVESAMAQFGMRSEKVNDITNNSNRILDVYTKVAHTGAASANDLTQATERAGTSAHQAGASFEFFNALVATGVRNTARSGAEIGQSLKSLFVSINSDKAIKEMDKLGVATYNYKEDGTKSFRSVQDRILDLSLAIQTTEKDTSKLELALSGGKFQVSKVTAILSDYHEIIRMWKNAVDSSGFTNEQVAIQLDTIARKMATTKTLFDTLVGGAANAGLATYIKEQIQSFNNFLTGLTSISTNMYQAASNTAKWSIELYALYKISTSLYTAMSAITTAATADTMAINSNTAAKAGNRAATIAQGTAQATTNILTANGTVLTRVNTAAKEVETVATTNLTRAQAIGAAVMGNIIPLLILAGGAMYAYSESMGEANNAVQKQADTEANRIETLNRKVESFKQEKEFILAISDAYDKQADALKNVDETSEKGQKIKQTMASLEKDITEELYKNIDANDQNRENVVENGKINREVIDRNLKAKELHSNELAEALRQDGENLRADAQNNRKWANDKMESMEKEIKMLGILEQAYLGYLKFMAGVYNKIADYQEQDANDPDVYAGVSVEKTPEQKAAKLAAAKEYRDKANGYTQQRANTYADYIGASQALRNANDQTLLSSKIRSDYIARQTDGMGGIVEDKAGKAKKEKAVPGANMKEPDDKVEKQFRDNLKHDINGKFDQDKISADKYAMALDLINTKESIMGVNNDIVSQRQEVTKKRVSELLGTSMEYMDMAGDFESQAQDIIDQNADLKADLDERKTNWKSMTKEQKESFKEQHKDFLEANKDILALDDAASRLKVKSAELSKQASQTATEELKKQLADQKALYDNAIQSNNLNKENALLGLGNHYTKEQADAIELMTAVNNLQLAKVRLKEIEDTLGKDNPTYKQQLVTIGQLANQVDTLGDKTRVIRQNMATMFDGMMRGTTSFKDFWKNAWMDMATEAINNIWKVNQAGSQTTLLGGLFGGLFGSKAKVQGPLMEDGSFFSKREMGGPVKAGTPYIVGEKRPELFVPDSNGTIIPDLSMVRSNGNSGGGAASAGDTSIKVEINPTFQSLDPAAGQAMFKAQIPQMLTAVEVALREKTSMKNAAKQAVK